MIHFKTLLAATALAGVSLASPAFATTVVYDSGPINGFVNALAINNSYATSNSFTLSAATILNGFSFGGWSAASTTIQSVRFQFSDAPVAGSTGSAVALSAGAAIPGAGFGAYDVRSYTASFAPVTLAAGTHFFTLSDAITSGASVAFWDLNSGSSTSYQNADPSGYGGQAFTLFGTAAVSAAPEPGTWAMMLVGFGMLGFAMRRRAKPAATAAFA